MWTTDICLCNYVKKERKSLNQSRSKETLDNSKNWIKVWKIYNFVGADYAELDHADFGNLRRREGEAQIHGGGI